MRSIRCYITVEDTPLCQYSEQIMNVLGISCDYPSITRAKQAIREIRKHRYWPSIKVVKGDCSSFKQ